MQTRSRPSICPRCSSAFPLLVAVSLFGIAKLSSTSPKRNLLQPVKSARFGVRAEASCGKARPLKRRQLGRGTSAMFLAGLSRGILPKDVAALDFSLPSGGSGKGSDALPGKIRGKDNTWEITIPGKFEREGESLLNKFAGNHVEQHKYISTEKPKYEVLVTEDSFPEGFKIPSLEDLAERTVDNEKGKTYVDDVELLGLDSATRNGVEYRDIRYMVTTPRDEDRFFGISATKNGRLYSLQIRVRNRDYERFSSTIDEIISSFKIM
mmetsp:Transcript_17435/g.27853  ORF Transcript_17435/g.27853 Transcript_17435/m.27853 type:complete len:266 (-) Transcript_17435:178-975(-)